MQEFKNFVADEKASGDPMDTVITVAVSLILVSTLGVAAWNLLGNANYSYNGSTGVGFDPTTKILVQTVVSVIGAIAVVILLVKTVKK